MKRFLLIFCLLLGTLIIDATGTEIATVVNNVPITTNAVMRRVALLRLRNIKGDLQAKARTELIDELLQKIEAERLNISISESEVEASYEKFAKDNNMPNASFLDEALTQQGVSVRSFKEYIRAGLRWQRVVGLRYRAQSQQDANSSNRLSYLFGGEDDEGLETIQYSVKHIIFVIPKEKLASQTNARMTQANNFRRQFGSCDDIIEVAKRFKNVSVLEQARVIEERIPARWRKEIKATPEGKLTRAIRTDRGVELYAVCRAEKLISSSSEAPDSIFDKNPAELNKELEEFGKKYLSELHEVATIRKN